MSGQGARPSLLRRLRWLAQGIRMRLRERSPTTLLKYAEVALLGRRASTWCYNFPSHVLVELTTRCNLRCVWCNQADDDWRERHGDREFDYEAFLRLLPQLKGAKVIQLYNIGEPLMYPRIFEAIAEARKVIPHVRITTNGTLLTEEKSRQLAQAGLTQLNVSIDGTDRATFERVRGIPLEKIERNLDAFCRLTKIPVQLWTVISEANLDSLERLPDYATRWPNARHLHFQMVNGFALTDRAGTPWVSSAERFDMFRERILARCDALGIESNIAHLKYYPPGTLARRRDGTCRALFTEQVSINHAGAITPCCGFSSFSLDEVLSKGFRAAWNGPAVRAWRRRMLDRDYGPYCENWCGFKKVRDADALDAPVAAGTIAAGTSSAGTAAAGRP